MRSLQETPSLFNNRLIQTRVDASTGEKYDYGEMMNSSSDSPTTIKYDIRSREGESGSPRNRGSVNHSRAGSVFDNIHLKTAARDSLLTR